MKTGKHRWIGITVFTLLYPILGLVVEYIPNPMVPGAIVALNMIMPVLAGYFYGSLSGAFAGGVGTALAALWGGSLFNGLAIFPHTVMGLAAGWAGRKRSDVLAAVCILAGHALNMLFYLRLGLITIAPGKWGITLLGLTTEALIDIVAIVLIISLCKRWLYRADRW